MAMQTLSLAVVGADYPNKRGPGRRFAIELCAPGSPVHLVPDPKNPADANAIAVFSREGLQMGYITAERAPLVGGWLRNGRAVEAVFQEKTSYGGVIRVALDGTPLELPSVREQQAELQEHDDSGFNPDWIPPDE